MKWNFILIFGISQLQPVTPKPENPCHPSPCGVNTHCRVENNYAYCECLPDYHGNPHEGCRPECLANSDCTMSLTCIRNKCQDPCPGTCGVGALCTVGNHIPICSCPDGYTGDAFRYCSYVIPEDKKPKDPCNPSPCGLNTICRISNENAICECLPGFQGTPATSGCKPECTISADCPRNKACVNTKCVDPCPGVCGFGAECFTINHSPVCSCPPPLIGDPFTLCVKEQPEPKDPCYPSPCRTNGNCRAVNGAAVCTYPECVINQDCPRDRACYSQRCHDPCIDSCGLNALCQVVNHKAICSCPTEYVGYPEVECTFKPKEEVKPECTQNSDCTNDKACIGEQCHNPCDEGINICGRNADCRVQLHRAICICKEGYSGNAQSACFEIGCRSDTECPFNQACVNNECVDPCSYTQCGLSAYCKSDDNHRARCYCPERFKGDPYERCERPECITDDECPFNLACQNERCEDPCNCGTGALCTVDRHRALCSCPPGYNGNPLDSCKIEKPIIPFQCRIDADCASKLACFSGVCQNPCLITKPCGINADCSVVDTLPLRTMSCLCLPGYVGDADIECKQVSTEEVGCKSNDDCASSEACIRRQCVNPCTIGNLCSTTAECHPANHKAVCRCPSGLYGDPFVKCYERTPQPTPECKSDADCPSNKGCTNQRCQDLCSISNPCGYQAECHTILHRPTCFCPDGWGGNPQQQCYKPQCKVNGDCPYDKQCVNDKCVDPCASHSCGRGADCVVTYHQAQCQCPGGTQGNPLSSCITGICQYNEDCADHEACDRLNRICRPVCNEDACADSATCIGRNHQPHCSCPPGKSGNPYVDCSTDEVKTTCKSDSDCPSQYGCVNSNCQHLCEITNICNLDQECRVIDTLPIRTVMCQCPSDTIADSSGHCKTLDSGQPQCSADSDCSDSDKCIHGHCIEACKVDACGYNAQCNSLHHQAVCSCSFGYFGNPHIECTNVPIYPPPVPLPECYKDDDCPYYQRCKNDICVNPCIADKPCAVGAFCSVNNHQSVCICPSGYEGNPKMECIPPVDHGIGCKSNSDCAGSESCVNSRCVSPCNCGPNAECKVTNHYPMCYCKQAYAGNPQIGCVKLGCQSDNECAHDQQCYNGQCVNPCILGDPCSSTAICYGNGHRAACKCPDGYAGNPLDACERVECHTDSDCPINRACIEQRCIDPCSSTANPACAQNARCYVQNHAAGCVCPPHLPEGNPLAYCTPKITEIGRFECEHDIDCPSKLACIKNACVNPCFELVPCHPTSHCSVLDTIPVRTMICTCPDGWVPNENGECHTITVPVPPGCSSDTDCPSDKACINRMCRNPCNCGTDSSCSVRDHRPICSCKDGYEGNPDTVCHKVGCRSNSACDSGKACINGNCLNPCLVREQCGINAECYVRGNQAECRCVSGYRGNPFERCLIVGCRTNSDCPGERQCVNSQCVNPCVYDNPCSSRAECKVQNHVALCRCRPGYIGNPFVQCRLEPQPECLQDPDCPATLACINNKCEDPCKTFEPCERPAKCEVANTVPLRTMICICPPGYISSGSGTCEPTKPVIEVGICKSDDDCSNDKACYSGICRTPCNCGPNSECLIKNHKPICICKQGYWGNPEIECVAVGCRSNSECSGQHACINRQCVPVCAANGTSCGNEAICYGNNHRAICECEPGFAGNPNIACATIGCRSNLDCPTNKACVNKKCESPCVLGKPCDESSECKVYNHEVECTCPPGYVNTKIGCAKAEEKCRSDSDCPLTTACINGKCDNPCLVIKPCGINADCKVLDTLPVRTMVCECLPGYNGNAAVRCEPASLCPLDKGYQITADGKCECPPGTALNENDECIYCQIEKGFKINEQGHCVCALERGMIVDEYGKCICPVEYGYRLDIHGNCTPIPGAECENNHDCPDQKFCNLITKTCDNPCLTTKCGKYAFCNAVNHQAVCQCQSGYSGNPDVDCTPSILHHRTDFPKPDMEVSCLSDGVQIQIDITDQGFNGVLYVKGHSKDEQCRRVITVPSNERSRTEIFKVQFGNCGLIHVNGQASFVLVIQKHPKLVTYKAQAYHIKCIYQTGEQNVTLGFNVSMLTTAGTIANTGPPPTCVMKIVTQTGQEVNSAEIGDNLMLQVEVQPGSIYGGFARSCIAKTMGDNVENEYIVTDENGCATDPTIFGEWEHNIDTQSLLASFNAFKFPSSDNIRFQCNIRVCFGRCQPVNCRGYNAFGRRKRAIDSENNTDVLVPGDLMSGQVREEITLQSNAILTFERREQRFVDPTEAPNAQRAAEDICVSMIGFIIALVITALLALVAIAVAVSCWLMAYRRRPKATGPLPHPPEFPNPLFTTPEPMAEPSPDYLT